MFSDAQPEAERRVLVVPPTKRDADVTCSLLTRAGLTCVVCTGLHELIQAVETGAGVILLTEEALTAPGIDELQAMLRGQPSWSDLGIVLLMKGGVTSPATDHVLRALNNVTLLERPAPVRSVLSAVQAAVRGRERQYYLREQMEALCQAEAKANEADRRKDEFLATLAHELRNPLAPIRNSLQLLRLSGELGPSLAPVHEIMERQVNHMVRLIDDLLDVSRIARGKVQLRLETVELTTIVAEAVEILRPQIDAMGQQLALSVPAEPMFLEADPVRLLQIIGNLLHNASKYTNAGGHIWFKARREEAEAIISIRDTGVGIPAPMLPRVFEMFAQADRSLTRAQGGLGIGLTLVKSFVEMHRGRIEARSDGPNQGSEFVVRLPLVADSQGRSISTSQGSAATQLPRRRILIVDDSRAAGYTLGKLLESLGQEVFVAHDGVAALESLKSERPDMVISDIAMPRMDGYEFARRLRQEPGMKELLLVALTGYGQDSDRRLAEEAGFDLHMVKPVSFEELHNLLSSFPASC